MASSIFWMYSVDTWLMYRGCMAYYLYPNHILNQQDFYSVLAEDLIDNNLQQVSTRKRAQRTEEERVNVSISDVDDFINLSPQLRATNQKKKKHIW